MPTTYFAKKPLEISVPTKFDPAVLAATLDEVGAWSGNYPAFANSESFRRVMANASTIEQFTRLKSWSDQSPELHCEFLRRVPSKFWAKSIGEYPDHATQIFGHLRKLETPKPLDPKRLRFTEAAGFLTDEELASFFPVLVDSSEQINSFDNDAIASRVMGLAKTKAQVLALWRKSEMLAWRVPRTMSDAQLLTVWTWMLETERAFRAGKTAHFRTECEMLAFELMRRGAMTKAMLDAYLKVVEMQWSGDAPLNVIALPNGSDESHSQVTVTAEIEALRDLQAKAAPLAPSLRDFVLRNPNSILEPSYQDGEVLLLLSLAWAPSLAPALSTAFEFAKGHLKTDKYGASLGASALAKALAFSPHANAMLAVIDKAVEGKRAIEMVAQARAQLANHEALLGHGAEAIQWGRTSPDDALRTLLRFADPMAAIQTGLDSTDPVAVLSAWVTAGLLFYEIRAKAAGAPRLVFAESLHIAALEKLERIYDAKAPHGAKLAKLLGEGRSGYLFDIAFGAAYEQYDRVWDRAGELYLATQNARYQAWIRPYADRMDL